jgi:hypothetical protein
MLAHMRHAKLIAVAAIAALGLSGCALLTVEEPSYRLVFKDDPFEIRDYPALAVAEATVEGGQKAAGNAGFRLLAGYIFGANTRRESIAMTAPVAQSQTAGENIAMTAPVAQTPSDGGWTVRFTMPAGKTLANLPVPDDARVKLREVPPVRVAVQRFSGWVDEGDFAHQRAALATRMAAHGLVAAGPPALAQYNPPWTLWFLRRNEVLQPVAGAPPG